MSALTALLKYLELLTDESNHGNYEFSTPNIKRFVHLDNAAISALNVFPKNDLKYNINSTKYTSVLSVLDHCKTAQGHRLIAQWLKQPLKDIDLIEERHNIVECLLNNISVCNSLQNDYLKRVPDLLQLLKKLLRKKASLQDIFKLFQVVVKVPKLLDILENLGDSTINNVIFHPLQNIIEDLALFKEMVIQVVDFDAVENGEYLVKSSFDEQLQKYKDKLDIIEESLQKQVKKAERELEMDNIKLDIVPHIGHHFRITSKDDTIIRRNKNYKIIDVVNSGVRFKTQKLCDLSDDHKEVKASYEKFQKTIVDEIIKTTGKFFFLFYTF